MFNPIEASNSIKQSYIDYISTTLHISDEHYRKLFREELCRNGVIAKGPYLDFSGSFECGRSLEDLVNCGLVSKLFLDLENVPEKKKELKIQRPLYTHQEQALLKANSGHNLVITTGTGSGKTECFLLPIMQSLLAEKEVGTISRSVRAIIIYPMNALANDQMIRLRKILATCPDITFGLYNSNTKHGKSEAHSSYRELYKEDPLPNEVISREVMQKEPPHILITNYSMLEYMMLRPKDDAVFSGARLRYIVLDEAHVYRGATGMETSLLMRRLRARISEPESVQYIITSATLGDKNADSDIVSFTENLCNAVFKTENIIRSREIIQPMIEHHEFPAQLFEELYNGKMPISSILRSYNADFAPDKDDNEKLYELICRSRLFERLRSLSNKPKTVQQLANEIGISNQELVHLIAASAKAVKEGTSLIKSRYHFFLRALEGVYITLAGQRKLFLTRTEYDSEENAVFECAVCEDCGRISISGFINSIRLLQPNGIYDDKTDYFLLKENNESDFYMESDDDARSTDEFDYVVCPICGVVEMESVARYTPPCKHSFSSYISIRKAEKRKNGKTACPACEFGEFKRFYIGYDAATAVIGTALYEQLPETENEIVLSEFDKTEEIGLFGRKKSTHNRTVNKPRQFLAFSDSRADAAFYASYMEKSYQEFLRRRGLWQACDKLISEGRQSVTVRDMVNRLARLFEKNRSFVELGKEAEDQTDTCREHAYIAVMNELVSSRRSSSLVQLGKMAFCYAPKDKDKRSKWDDAIPVIEEVLPLPEEAARDARALLNLLMMDVVYSGALDAGTEFDISGEKCEYLFFVPIPQKIVMMQTEKSKSYLNSWIPKKRTGKTQSYYRNTRMTRVKRALNYDDEQAWNLLEAFWRNILGFEAETKYALSIQDFDILLYGRDENNITNLKLYRCDRCGRVTMNNCQNKCVNIKCSGSLVEFDPSMSIVNNHYAKLYSVENMSPLYIKEHTAQLSRDRAADYQHKFIEKRINALSSSTTFEMGVDVGSLETVFLRNIPPTPANYVQRAGRAGRSLQSAAYALTYAKLSSHDFTYFEHPEYMIRGIIKAPRFKLENEKVVRRHINAVALSAFLKQQPEVYGKDDQTELLNSDGFEKFNGFLTSKPYYLKELLMKSIPSADSFGIEDWSWIDNLTGKEGILRLAVEDFRGIINELEKERIKCRKAGDDQGAAAYERKLKSFRGDTSKDEPRRSLIDFLVRNNILPKYGFPIDTVELLPDSLSFDDNNRPQMQRDLQLAVAEYAPGAQIVADGKLYTSRYIRKLQSKNMNNWEYGHYKECHNPHCKAINFVKDTTWKALTCISCGEKMPKLSNWHKTLEPRRGFISEKPIEVKMSRKPEKVYKTDDFYIGDPRRKTIDKLIFNINGKTVAVESTTNDSLVVLTRSRFRVCSACGYAVGEEESKSYGEHKNSLGYKCINEDAGLEYYLSHDFKTDVARVTFEVPEAYDNNRILSVLYALLEAISKELDIERNDIKGCLYKIKLNDGFLVNSIVLYDSVAGGAGHIRRIVTQDGSMLSRIINRAVSLMDSCDCDPSCYKCLRNYYNQKIHNILSRNDAADFLRGFTGKIKAIYIDAGSPAPVDNYDIKISE